MLAVSRYEKTYIDDVRARIGAQVAAFRALAETIPGDGPQAAALATLEPVYFNNLVLALDGHFVHRTRAVEGKDGNPLNEVRVLCQSLTSGGVMTMDKTIRMKPEKTVLGYAVGDEIRLTLADFERLAEACLAEL